MVGAVATRLAGSADLYQATGHMPINSINFITCHDGFTLNDLVSYNHKHNEANGEDNRDGNEQNLSWNCGVEGETNDAGIETVRERQIKNFVALLMLSQGVPMLLAGDEVRRTQRGNNNAYCQDNETSWFDWTLVEKNTGLLRFFKQMIAFRKQHPSVRRERFFTDGTNERGMREINWHGCQLFAQDWHDPNCRILACTIWSLSRDDDLHVMLNMEWTDMDFEVPTLQKKRWLKVIDTALPSPLDFDESGRGRVISGGVCHVQEHSVVVLISG
jgi:glycogen operon protein